MSIKALEAGKHVLSEIPVIHSMQDIIDLKAAVKAHPEAKYFCGWQANLKTHLCVASSIRAMPEKEKLPAMRVDNYCM